MTTEIFYVLIELLIYLTNLTWDVRIYQKSYWLLQGLVSSLKNGSTAILGTANRWSWYKVDYPPLNLLSQAFLKAWSSVP